ncbi:MAG: hypothetical protein ACOY4Q_02170 [Bacillota bacterium]
MSKQTADIIGYMALSSDSFRLDQDEKEKEGFDIPYNSVPALKIGKLAISSDYKDNSYGSFMLWLALGYAEQLNRIGVGCRFIVVDADIEHNPDTPEFYVCALIYFRIKTPLNGVFFLWKHCHIIWWPALPQRYTRVKYYYQQHSLKGQENTLFESN